MDIPINAGVFCCDNLCGHSIYVLLNPTDRQITHLVVREKALPRSLRIVPIDRVVESTSNLIDLSCTPEELAKMDPFIEFDPIPQDLLVYGNLNNPIWPNAIQPNVLMSLEHRHIPPGELAVRRGVPVEANHALLGWLNEFLIDPKTGKITRLVLRKRRWFRNKDFLVPVSIIDHIDQNDGVVSDFIAG
jgi:hypothetical protein